MSQPSERRERIVVPNRPIREFASEAVKDLARVIAQLEGWMERPFPRESRPYAALAVLNDMEATGRFTREQRGDDSGPRALQLALDLSAIAESLPATKVADLRRDLEKCASGPLDPPPEALESLQHQTQLVVRGALYRAGVAPGQPTYSTQGGRKKPDILVERGLSVYGIEVKRPTALKNVLPRARDAADQLRNAGLNGGAVIDITDALTVGTPQAMDDEVLRQAKVVMSAFFTDGKGWTPGFKHMMMITVLARPPWQVTMTNEKDGEVNIYSTSAGVALGTADGTLDTIRAHWMRDTLARGLDKLGFTSAEG